MSIREGWGFDEGAGLHISAGYELARYFGVEATLLAGIVERSNSRTHRVECLNVRGLSVTFNVLGY